MSIQSMLNTVCDIQAEVQTTTATGFASVTWSTVSSGVACRVTDPKPSVAQMIYGKFDAMNQKRVYFASDPSLTVANRLVWKGINLYVHSVMNQGGSLGRLFACDCATYPLTD